jgi:DMSO/TMAO reductase YedYZ molybdopterin-dependent catalytic subunit
MNAAILRIDGEVQRPLSLTYDDLAAIPDQVPDVSRLIPGRQGDAVALEALLILAGVKPSATYLTLHASRDDFHASVPLVAVRDRGLLLYRLGDGPLPESAGGPLRFLIPDPAACRSADVDECANVKYVDRIELSVVRGHDNRPTDEVQHAKLHRQQK